MGLRWDISKGKTGFNKIKKNDSILKYDELSTKIDTLNNCRDKLDPGVPAVYHQSLVNDILIEQNNIIIELLTKLIK